MNNILILTVYSLMHLNLTGEQNFYKNILIASDYGSPQGRKRAIVGDYIIPTITHSHATNIYIDKILEALGSPLNNTKQTISDPSFPLILTKNDVTDHFYDSEIPHEWAVKARRYHPLPASVAVKVAPEIPTVLVANVSKSKTVRSPIKIFLKATPGNFFGICISGPENLCVSVPHVL